MHQYNLIIKGLDVTEANILEQTEAFFFQYFEMTNLVKSAKFISKPNSRIIVQAEINSIEKKLQILQDKRVKLAPTKITVEPDL